MTAARAHHDSPFGRIEVAWQLDAGRGQLNVSVPPGTEATVSLPDGAGDTFIPGTHHLQWDASITGS